MSDGNGGNGGGRTLGGGDPEPLPSGWGAPAAPRVGRVGGPSTSRATPSHAGGPRIASLRDIASGGGGGGRGPAPPPHNHSDGEDSDDDGAAGENWFAGGERSGINVENPDRPSGSSGTVRDILRKAAQAPSAPADPAPSRGGARGGGAFFGSGNTLGSDEVESELIPDPDAMDAEPDEQETAVRNLTFWKDGFSIEDGPLMPYDDPENQKLLDAINSGNAPPSFLNVQINQPVELRVARRLDEAYQAQPKKRQAFSGAGNRLGSPAPPSTSGAGPSSSQHVPGAFPSSSAAPSTFDESRVGSITTRFEVDMNLPNTSVQIRLADGTRLVSRMNLTHTVGDIRSFINASRPATEQRPYTIGTTFPNKTLDDDSVTIEAGGLKNSVIVQRWV